MLPEKPVNNQCCYPGLQTELWGTGASYKYKVASTCTFLLPCLWGVCTPWDDGGRAIRPSSEAWWEWNLLEANSFLNGNLSFVACAQTSLMLLDHSLSCYITVQPFNCSIIDFLVRVARGLMNVKCL